MVLTAGDLAAVGIDTPLLVGGAALTRRFTHRKIAQAYSGLCTYAKDAMHGLKLVERLLDPGAEAAIWSARSPICIAADNADAAPEPTEAVEAGRNAAAEVRRDLPCPRRPTSTATSRSSTSTGSGSTSTRR